MSASTAFTAISRDLTELDAESEALALRGTSKEITELGFAVHTLTRCVERLLGQVTTLKFEVAALRLVNSESEPERG